MRPHVCVCVCACGARARKILHVTLLYLIGVLSCVHITELSFSQNVLQVYPVPI